MNEVKYGKIVDFVHMLVRGSYEGRSGLNLVDATCGNGFDTLFLCSTADRSGHVTAFDIQDAAIERTSLLLNSNLDYVNYEIVKDSHEYASKYISGKIDAAVFNLGYLPFSDKKVTTEPETTCRALKNMLPMLSDEGRIYVTSYITHDTGKEINEVENMLSDLSRTMYNVVKVKVINKENNPPELFIIEKNA
jgi:16S rRNA C1402 N4-methylase RsmH